MKRARRKGTEWLPPRRLTRPKVFWPGNRRSPDSRRYVPLTVAGPCGLYTQLPLLPDDGCYHGGSARVRRGFDGGSTVVRRAFYNGSMSKSSVVTVRETPI